MTQTPKTIYDLTVDMAQALMRIRRTQTINTLLYSKEVMGHLKNMPSLQQQTGALTLSMLTPTIQESTEDQEEQQPQTKKSGRWYQNIPSKVKRK